MRRLHVARGGDGGVNCAALESQYGAALSAAEACDLNASGQCQHLVGSFLPMLACNTGCSTIYVNAPTALGAIQASWEQAGCNPSRIHRVRGRCHIAS
jgi:hypothetical protein